MRHVRFRGSTLFSRITDGFCDFPSSEFAPHYKTSSFRAAVFRPNCIPLTASANDRVCLVREATCAVPKANGCILFLTRACSHWKGDVSVPQGVGWRRSRAYGSALQQGRMRPLAIWSQAFYLTTVPGWTVARAKQQWRPPPGTRRPMAFQSRAFASARSPELHKIPLLTETLTH